MRFGSQNIDFYADPGHREAMRADPLERAADSAAALIAAVDTVPYRRRRGPFMDPGMNEKADKFNVEHEMFNRIRERPYTGPMWQLARFLETLRRFKRWILDILRHFKRWTEDLFSGNRQQG
jgi:broad specificity phosphatase PhoE